MRYGFQRFAFLLLGALSSLLPSALRAQDALALGRVSSGPGVVRVPVYLRMVGETAFNSTAGVALQGIAFRVNFAPSARVSSVRVDRTGAAGLLSDLSPIFESSPRTAASVSYIGVFEQKIPAAIDAAEPGQKILDLVFTVEPGGGSGAILLELDREVTTLSNQGGTVGESVKGGSLRLASGSIEIQDERRVGPRVDRQSRPR